MYMCHIYKVLNIFGVVTVISHFYFFKTVVLFLSVHLKLFI